MSFWSNIFGGNKAGESATVRAARDSGANVSGYVMCVNILDDALTVAAQKAGIAFRAGARERIRKVLHEEISANGVDKVLLQQTIQEALAQAIGGGNFNLPNTLTPTNSFTPPPGYQLIPITSPQPVATTQHLVWEEETKEEVEPQKGKKKKV